MRLRRKKLPTFYGKTPYGNVDVIPVEAKSRVLNEYRGLVLVRYNRLEEEDGKKLLSYLRRGGRLLLYAPPWG